MSTTETNIVEEKSEDKKEIEDEEREKMLNEENIRTAEEETVEKAQETVIKPIRRECEGEVEKMRKALEESEKESSKKKIPIGGIKMPGFLRSRSREKTKEGELDIEEGRDLLQEQSCVAATVNAADGKLEKEETPTSKGPRLPTLKLMNPFAKKKTPGGEGTGSEAGGSITGEDEHSKRASLLEAIRLPLVSVFPRSKLRSTKDPEIGQAGLASMETLDDSMGEKPEKMTNGEDGMESVKLDSEEKIDPDKKEDPDEKNDWRERLHALTKFQLIVGGSALFLVLLIIIVIVTPFGSQYEVPTFPVAGDRYRVALTSCGYVEGLVEDGAFAFRGIPYALPPVGERRWKPAHPLNSLDSCWNGTRLVHDAATSCWQFYLNGTMDGAEDCLTLDIFTPHMSYWNPLPVVVLIGAESLSGGSPGVLQASAKLAHTKDVVFVRPNFRLGVLGFLAADAIKRDNHPPTSGNYGLSDLVVALNWIQLNIEHFGGDKNSVTVLGHRAGGTLVTALTASRESKGLFSRAWVSSGGSIFPGKELMESERDNAAYMELLGCGDDVQCMRQKDVEDLLQTVPKSWRQPLQGLPLRDDVGSSFEHQWLVLDGKYLQEHVSDAWKNNKVNAKIIMGSTVHSDIPPNLREKHTNWTSEAVESYVKSSVIGKTDDLMKEALQRYGTDWPGLMAMISDIRTVCPLQYLSQQRNTTIPFYLVNHTRQDASSGEDMADVAVDVEAILGLYEPQCQSDRRYIKRMQDLFYHFVRHGELKDKDVLGSNQALMIDESIIKYNNFSNCDLWFAKDIVPRYGRID